MLRLPLKQHRRPDAEGGAVMCTDPSRVPDEPVPVAFSADELNESVSIKLGVIELPLYPFLLVESQQTSKSKRGDQKNMGEVELEVWPILLVACSYLLMANCFALDQSAHPAITPGLPFVFVYSPIRNGQTSG